MNTSQEDIINKVNVVYSKYPLGVDNVSQYYDQLASLYGQFYEDTDYLGIDINHSLQKDVQQIIYTLNKIKVDGLIDVGSGTGYWRKFFKNLKKLLAIDISKNMLIQSKNEIVARSLIEKNKYFEMNCNIIDLDLENIVGYEAVFIGFILSHYSNSDIMKILNNIKKNKNIRYIIIIDSVYGKYRINRKNMETYKNIVSDEKKISVYKRYFTKNNWLELLEEIEMSTRINKSYWGETFFIEVIYI